jgi:hypothetical protein
VPGRLGLGACAKRFIGLQREAGAVKIVGPTEPDKRSAARRKRRKERERSEKGARKGINANRASRICGERTLLIERLSI